MNSTGFIRRIDELGRVVILKEIRRTTRIKEGEAFITSFMPFDRFCVAIHRVSYKLKAKSNPPDSFDPFCFSFVRVDNKQYVCYNDFVNL